MRIRFAWLWVWIGIAVWPMAFFTGFVVPRMPWGFAFAYFPMIVGIFGGATFLVVRMAGTVADPGKLAVGVIAALLADVLAGPVIARVNPVLTSLRLRPVLAGDKWLVVAAGSLSLGCLLGLFILVSRTARARVPIAVACLLGVSLWVSVAADVTLQNELLLYRWFGEAAGGLEYQAFLGVPVAAFASVLMLRLLGVREPPGAGAAPDS